MTTNQQNRFDETKYRIYGWFQIKHLVNIVNVLHLCFCLFELSWAVESICRWYKQGERMWYIEKLMTKKSDDTVAGHAALMIALSNANFLEFYRSTNLFYILFNNGSNGFAYFIWHAISLLTICLALHAVHTVNTADMVPKTVFDGCSALITALFPTLISFDTGYPFPASFKAVIICCLNCLSLSLNAKLHLGYLTAKQKFFRRHPELQQQRQFQNLAVTRQNRSAAQNASVQPGTTICSLELAEIPENRAPVAVTSADNEKCFEQDNDKNEAQVTIRF